ncbi:MAG: ABC transporter ATP-binding protein [Gemmatimonadetes bacterium]|nr:ABC transporter ATP-binding protein [Gemmatimonadota bacterium]
MNELAGAIPSEQAAAAPAEPVLEGQALRKTYIEEDGSELTVLDGVEIRVAPAEAVAVVGASGAGKSTLLHLLGGLDRPTSGRVTLGGRDLASLAEPELAAARNARIGFVFQFHHLLREFSALENVMMPLLIAGAPAAVAQHRARGLLEEVGLGERLGHKPWQLSGGEQQRVAVARALANRPLLLLADEPSGNLDTHTSEQLHDLFFRLRAEHRVAMVVATHNRELADRADRILLLKEGRLRSIYPPD